MITLNNVSKKFGNNTILENIDLKLEKGKIYGFEGRNGCGKTLLFKMICGFTAPSTGTISINGQEVGKDIDFPEKCGLLIENPGFIERFSGYKNLKLLADINKTIGDEEIKKWMDFYDLDFSSRKKVKNYSLGMKQKLGIIQAIMENPKVIVLDEPMNALDENSILKTRELLHTLKKDSIILISSHNSEDLNCLCDKIFSVKDGKVS